MKIAVLGLGYVGITAMACLASQGHEVIGVDPNMTKVDAVLSGRSPITEPGIGDMIAEARRMELITATASVTSDVVDSDLIIVCVGTPSAVDGSHNMTFIAEVSRQLAEVIKTVPHCAPTVAYRSTVRPGTMDELIKPIFDGVLGDEVERVELVYYPEFLRESTAVEDYFSPPKIVVGTHDGDACPTLDKINADLNAPVFYVRYRESEITKFVDNTFHAVKTVFANEVGRVCAKLGISATEVHKIFVSDTKLNVSPTYLRPGGAFGGSCLPKDVRALQHISRTSGGFTHLIDSLLASNESHKNFLYEHVTSGLAHGARVLLLGIAFKNDSDDLRESPNVDLARMLITAGYQLSIFDPHIEPQNLMGQNLGVLSNSPFIRQLLIGQEVVENTAWDLVIDTRSCAGRYTITAVRVVDINRLA
ncbi:nucleotide sugar dehydrogenase [Mycolicibacterium confluentis]|uniref:UDP-glucose 6-dehydrogenase n=1 Tax=Mycolicibacterium confluentis TaxID=28047 RepID=A0A7I7XZT4_9MYCO|nr:nucleotide sugar dehydrogenase [Mycolicibacterium confluentis]MCV7319880.1 nucleotide sugar dehydrogenase [Mycolicibacterium confluentis]ORV34447.1 GDP-mannose dehydrogenase [Mycolicibacterium confluentis]BBZ34910.1 GDP-mannose 6-dehydrogenase [Mycolicibacterium confluentis]